MLTVLAPGTYAVRECQILQYGINSKRNPHMSFHMDLCKVVEPGSRASISHGSESLHESSEL